MTDRLIEVKLRLPRLVRLQVGQTTVEVGEHVRPVAADARRVGVDRLERTVEFDEGQPAPEFRPRVVVGNACGILEILEGDAVQAEVEPGDATTQVEFGILRVDRQAPRAGIDAAFEVTEPPRCDAKREVGERHLRVEFDHLADLLAGLFELPSLVELLRLSEQFFGRCRLPVFALAVAHRGTRPV